MERTKNRRNRNTALLLIGTGFFLLMHKWVSFGTIVALLFLLLGAYLIAAGGEKKGYLLAGFGVIILISEHFLAVLLILLLFAVLFYMKYRKRPREDFYIKKHIDDFYLKKHKVVESLRRDRGPWVLRNMNLWNIFGEVNLDLSLSIPEQEETEIVIEGIFGDIDILIPEHYGVKVNASVLFGQVSAHVEKESGMTAKVSWQSPHYDASEHKVNLHIFYVVGNIDIKML